LESAVYSDGIYNGDFDTGYTYDANGNILALSRKANGTPVDVLTYSYISSGNRLQSVTDGGNSEGYFAVPGENYEYDTNGNLTTDPSKGTGIEYNYLNLPSRVTFDLDDEVRYTYDAAGNKLVKAIQINGTTGEGRLNYCGNFLYEGTVLKAIFTSAGRIVPFDNNGSVLYKFEYNLQDHLGNTRVVFSGHSNGRPEVMQVTDYYPFGLVMNQQNYFASGVLSNKYLYNNKELQDDELAGNSLGWYDFHARYYDPAIVSTLTPDPHAEDYYSESPYSFMGNNPIINIDLSGMNYNPVYNYDGEFLGTDDHGLQGEVIIMDEADFTQGMSHDDALSSGTLFSDLGGLDRWNFMESGYAHWQSLDQRPDWDGFVTIQEGIDWAKSHLGALNNPTADNMLYLDASKLDFGNISVSDFKNGAFKASPINLLNKGNLKASTKNETLRATVYALGRVNMLLHGTGSGTVSIVNDFNLHSGRATDYDWNTGGTLLRQTLINAERRRTGIDDTHGFRTYYYGKGRLNINQ
jgi:RHS repeat-associated protein